MTRANIVVISLAVLFISAYISRPTPDDIVTHALAKCAKPEEKAIMAIGLSLFLPKSGQHSHLNPLSSLIMAETKGRVLFHEDWFTTRVSMDGKTVAFAAFGMYKIPTCKQLRSIK